MKDPGRLRVATLTSSVQHRVAATFDRMETVPSASGAIASAS
jgi:hypothetical protein